VGVYPFRCGDCKQRFELSIWSLKTIPYSRCPLCLRMDLNTWNEVKYPSTAWQRFRISLGGKPYRCEYCRCNFVSFRRRKERFSFHRWRKLKADRVPRGGAPPVPPHS
jgi:DNA-directed RNA polymerase subunit RPC12/RpoP